MTKEQFAGMLNGREYREEITLKECKAAEENGLVVIFGEAMTLLSSEE